MVDKNILDIDQLLTSTCDDRELANQVALVFLADIPVQFADLEKAIEATDCITAERVAHSIKGAAATMGASTLRQNAYTCEQAALATRLDPVRDMLPTLKENFSAVRDALAEAGLV